MKNSIIYPGTFDPITNGHIDLIERASNLFDNVIVAVTSNPYKKTLFVLEQRESLITASVAKYKNVSVCSFTGLLINFASSKRIKMVLRGLRAVSDFEYELQLANLNRAMDSKIETVFLTPSERYSYISSSMVRQIASLGGDVSQFVPEIVKDALKSIFSNLQ